MTEKTTKELKQEYEILKLLISFQSKSEFMGSKELEDYINSALENLKEIRVELEKRGESI